MILQSIRRITVVGTMMLGLVSGGSAMVMAAGAGPVDHVSLLSAHETPSASPEACLDDTSDDSNATPSAEEANTNGATDDEESADTDDKDEAETSDDEENDNNDESDDDSDSVDQESSDTETDDDGCDDQGSDAGAPGELMDGQDLQSQVSISLDEAITVAQGSSEGQLGTVDLEDENGQLVYKVTIGDQEVIVDANTGEIVGTEPVD